MSDQPCPGRSCNGRYWSAMSAYERDLAAYKPLDADSSRPEPPGDDLIRAWGDPVWCGDCQALIGLHLDQLDTLAALRASRADGHGEADGGDEKGGKRGKASEAPSPSPALDDRAELYSLLSWWEAEWRSAKGWNAAPHRGDLAAAETEVIAWLGKNLRGVHGILASEYAEGFGQDVLAWHRRLSRAEKAGVRTLRLPLRCPRCHILSLTWEEGSDRVQCGDDICGYIMTRSEYDNEVTRLHEAAAAGTYAPLPANEASDAA